MRIKCGHEEAIAGDGEATVDQATTCFDALRQLSLVSPNLTSCLAINRPCVILRAGHVQDAIDHDGCGLELARDNPGLKRPLRCQVSDICRRDLLQRTVPTSRV